RPSFSAANGRVPPTCDFQPDRQGGLPKPMNRADSQDCRTKIGAVLLALTLFVPLGGSLLAGQQASPPARVLGTVEAINGKSLTVLSDSGTAFAVAIEDATKLLEIEPGKTDLKEATPISLSDLQPGDRVLVRGVTAADGKTVRAASLVAMKKAAISRKQDKER